MQVKELMVPLGLIVAREDDRLVLSAQMMLWGRVRHLPVVRGAEVVGVLSEHDILVRRGEREKGRWEDALVREVMSQPAVVAAPDEELSQAAERMTTRRIGCLPVVESGRLVGIITTTDIVDAATVSNLLVERQPLQRPVQEAMQAEVFSVRADDDLMEAVDIMSSRRVRHLPVVGDDGRVVGILSAHAGPPFIEDAALEPNLLTARLPPEVRPYLDPLSGR